VLYNAELTEKGLKGVGLANIKPKDVQVLYSVVHVGELQRVGRAVSEKVIPEHSSGF
jgi:hypothetical protein